MEEEKLSLHRILGASAITVYAIGDILGAGIYALVGKVVAEAQGGAWISFVLSAVIALLTGLTYAELCSRYPVAAGAAAYCRRAYAHPLVAFLVGMFVLASGITSAATVANASVGYLNSFFVVSPIVGSLGLLLIMTAINFLGIQESARVNFFLTVIELGGLLLVIGAGLYYVSAYVPAEQVSERLRPSGEVAPLLSAATVAFFAYIGFEDTANIAEEVRDAGRVMPRAILVAISFTCVLYVTIAAVALAVVPMGTLAASDAPLLEVLNVAGVHLPANTFSLIALFAICNTGLLNLIMVSRLGYGMAREGLLPAVLAEVHPIRRTPWVAVLVASGLASLLAVSGGVKILAQTTSLLLLGVFTVLHIGLLRIKRREPQPGPGVFRTPAWTALLGALVCGGMTLQYPSGAYFRALLVLAGAGLLYVALHRGKRPPGELSRAAS